MMGSAILWGLVRHGLTTAGGALVAKGIIEPVGLELVLGGLATVFGGGWSLADKWTRRGR